MSTRSITIGGRAFAVATVKTAVAAVLAVILVVLMALNTTAVSDEAAAAANGGAFNQDTYGKTEFPKVQAGIEKRAVDAKTLAAALHNDQAGASKKYGVPTNTGTEFSVRFTGTAGKPSDGFTPVTVAGLPQGLSIRVQTGPAIIGTDLRDATGTIDFSQFTNQIDYQNAGAALNDELKSAVLAKIDVAQLNGKTITVVGAFSLINPDNWLVTPAEVTVQ